MLLPVGRSLIPNGWWPPKGTRVHKGGTRDVLERERGREGRREVGKEGKREGEFTLT